MGGAGATERGAAAMRSPVGWAVLGLVIQRASYGYELVQRFQRTYGSALELSSPSQIYTALDTLASRALVEQFAEKLPAESSRGGIGRQPKPHYRATAAGVGAYREWLLAQQHDERRRSRLFALQLVMLAPSDAQAVLERMERACLTRAARGMRIAGANNGSPREPGGLVERLVCEEDRLAVDARLAWIGYARRELGALATGPERPR
jgi:DNA-binding PadR family transcriptional regulator